MPQFVVDRYLLPRDAGRHSADGPRSESVATSEMSIATETAANIRIDSQISLADKIALADVTLDNSTNIRDLEHQIDLQFKT